MAIYWLLMLLGRFCSSFISGAVSSRTQLIVVATVAILLVVGAIFTSPQCTLPVPEFIYGPEDCVAGEYVQAVVPVSACLLILCGLCTSVMWGGIFNLAVEGLGKYTSMGSGIFMVMVCGGGILPLIQGYVADISNYLSSYWVIIAGLAYMLFYALVGSKNVNKDIPVED